MLFLRPELLLWDGGSCRHIINGLMILNDHQIPATNYASAIFPNSECFTRGWLSDLISGLFYQQAQLTRRRIYLQLVIAIGLTWDVPDGKSPRLRLSFWHDHAFSSNGHSRPALVCPLSCIQLSAVLILYYALFMLDDRRKTMSSHTLLRVALIGISMCAWANLHGSFMIGAIMIGIKTFFDAIEVGRKRNLTETVSRLKADMIGLSVAVVATCINPRGISFYTHVFSYLAILSLCTKPTNGRPSTSLPAWAPGAIFCFWP